MVLVWDAKTGALTQTLRCGSRPYVAVQLSNDAARVMVSDLKGVSVWDVTAGRRLYDLPKPNGEMVSAEYVLGGTHLMTLDASGTLRFWNSADGSLAHAMGGVKTPISVAAMSPDGTLLATAAGSNDAVQVWRKCRLFSLARFLLLPAFWLSLIFGSLFTWSIFSDRRVLRRARRPARSREVDKPSELTPAHG
jgi:WD40 repeat protein